MATADDKTNTPDEKAKAEFDSALASIKSELAQQAQDVQAQLKAMNDTFANLASATVNQQRATETEDDEDIYDNRKLKANVLSQAQKIMEQQLAEERRKNAVIFNLAQEYPEIQSDRDLQKKISEAQSTLPKSIQETADGYEMAVLKAIAKQGILPKSKRPTIEDDVSASGSRESSARARSTSKGKVTDKMMALAELLGRDTKDPEVIKGLEKAASRDTYGRYR